MSKAKKMLMSIARRDKIIELKLEELERQKRLCEVRAVTFGERVQSSGMESSMKVIDYIQMKDEVDEYIKKTLELKKYVMDVMDKMENEIYIELLYRRYFEKMTFEQIAEKLHLSNKRVYQLHKIALKALDCELDKIRKS